MAEENENNWQVLLSALTRLEEGQRALQVNQASTMERLQRLEQGAGSCAEIVRSEVRDAEPLTSEARGMLHVLYKNIPMFEYNMDQIASFANWYKDHEELVEVQPACVPESNIIRFLLSRLGPQQENDLKLRCLLKRPIEMRLAEVIEKLKIVFVTKKSLFRKRIECLHVMKQVGVDYKTHIGVVNQSCDEFAFSELTDTQFRVLNYLNSLRNHEDMEMRAWLIRVLDRTPDMSLDDVGEAIDRYFEHKYDIDLPVTSVVVSEIGKSTREHRRDEGRFTQESCKYCGRDSGHRSCPAQEKTCNNCGRRGHFVVVCQQKKPRKALEVSSRSVGGRCVNILMNGRKVRLQLDTGSDLTLISEATWKALGRSCLTSPSPSIVATAANGGKLELLGAFECNVSYQGEQITGIVHVTARMDLLGLDWLERFPSFRSVMDAVCGRVFSKSSIRTSKSESAARYVGALKTQFADVFTAKFGLCKKTQARRQLRKEGSKAAFRPKSMVPDHYEENEQELGRQEKEQLGVIERVAYSAWAAPSLCVKKSVGSVRVCADFSSGLTALKDLTHPIETTEENMTTIHGGTVFTRLDCKDAYLSFQKQPDSFSPLVVDGQFVPDEVTHIETWRALEKLHKDGKLRALGLSNFNDEQVKDLYEKAEVKPSNLQVECHIYWPQFELHELCRKLNISFTAYAPIGSPGRKNARPDGTWPEGEPMEDPLVQELARKYHKTPAQILLRHLTQRGISAIPKSVRPDRVLENIQIFDFKLTDDEYNRLNKIDRRVRLFLFDFGAHHRYFPHKDVKLELVHKQP